MIKMELATESKLIITAAKPIRTNSDLKLATEPQNQCGLAFICCSTQFAVANKIQKTAQQSQFGEFSQQHGALV